MKAEVSPFSYVSVRVCVHLKKEAVSALSPENFRARLILTVLLIHLQFLFLTETRTKEDLLFKNNCITV